MVLPAFMQRGKAQYMTSGSLIPRQEVDLETGHSLCEDWTTEIIYLSAKTTKTRGPAKTYFTQAGLCCIEIQVRSILDRDQFLALYLARRSIFWVSPMQKILFPYTKDTFCGSLDTEPVSCICIADPKFNVSSTTLDVCLTCG